MASRGRPPKPNPALLPFSGDVERSEVVGVPTCPKELDAVAKKKWAETAKLMQSLGTLNKSHRDMLAQYCAAYSRWLEADATVKEKGSVLVSGQGGLYRSPYLDVANHAAKEMQALSKLLGLDPMTQKRLGVKVVKGTAEKRAAVRDRTKTPKNAAE